jgi:histidinol-phosphate phosphatase family protein
MAGWTLFLDRDGVLNRRIPDGYVRCVDDMEVLPGVVDAVTELCELVARVVVVTNQAGVGKGLMTTAALEDIHRVLVQRLTSRGARIDAVLYCPHRVEDACPCRKPAPGMAWEAMRRFPDIHSERCVMVGDSLSDCEFAHAVGMRALFIGDPVDLGATRVWDVADDLMSAVPLMKRLVTSSGPSEP